MSTTAFQKVYTKLTQVTKATCTVKASGVGYEELATVSGRLAQVVKIIDDSVTLQIFSGTEGIGTDAEIVFFGKPKAYMEEFTRSAAALIMREAGF